MSQERDTHMLIVGWSRVLVQKKEESPHHRETHCVRAHVYITNRH